MLDRLELRAPGFTQIKLNGRLYPTSKGLGFAGDTTVDSSDPKNLAGWIAGRNSTGVQMKPWRATGHVTLSADRIAVERLQTEFGRGPIEGSVAYIWSNSDRPARLDANLRAAEFDVDAALGFGVSALSGLGLEAPREVALGLEFDRVRLATLEARNVTARLTIDRNGVAIERLSIVDLGNAGIVASGRIDTGGSPGGNIALDLDARDLAGVIALAESYAPLWAEPLRRLAGRQNGMKLQAKVSVADASSGTTGKLDVSGRVGDARVKVAASATGKADSFSPTNLRLLADTDIRLEGALEADEPATLLALVGLARLPVAERRPARLSLTAQGPPSRDFRFDASLSAGPIDASGKGTFQLLPNEPPQLDLDRIAGTIGGRKVQGKLALRFDDTVRVDGSVETDTIDAGGTIAAAIGMPASRSGPGWPTEPLTLNTSGLSGRIEFKAQRAAFSPAIVVQQFRGTARISPSEIVFEDVTGELGKGRFEGRLAFASGADGVTTRARVALRNAEAGALFLRADGPAISGRLSAQAEVEGAGRSPAAFMGSLAGFGTVTLEQGQVAGIYPGVFEAMNRALELGMPTGGNRVRDFVNGVLDGTRIAVPRASANISVNSGQARFSDISIRSTGADVEAIAGINLLDATLDASLTLAGPPAGAGKARPSMRIALNGPVMAPERRVDTAALMHWLTLLSAEQQARQIDAMERAAREAAAAEAAAAEAKRARDAAAAQPQTAASFGSEAAPALPETKAGETAPAADAPAPAVEAPPMPRPRVAPRPQRAPMRIVDPPGLVGAQP
jgi:large subunit ribosomal protein L24